MEHRCKNCGSAEKVDGYYCTGFTKPVQGNGRCADWIPSGHHDAREQIEQIADAYEFTHQSMKLFEEMGELQQALAKLALDDGPESEYDANLPNVKEELADVQIMLLQIIYLLDIDDGELKQIMGSKLDRQIKRMEGDG